jgi:protein-S-isoprenylcysteine O-methyltransferase Ste14
LLPLVYTNHLATGIFLAACLAWLAPEWFVAYRYRAKVVRRDVGVRDRGSLWLLIGLQWTGLALDFALAGLLPAAALPWQRVVIFGVGISMILCGVALRWYAIRVLGHYFTREVAASNDQPVVQNGPYHYLRHPAYSGTFLTMLGVGLALGNWAGLLVLLLCVFAGHLYRVRVEEQVLLQSIGQPYADYMRQTRRFLPWII